MGFKCGIDLMVWLVKLNLWDLPACDVHETSTDLVAQNGK